MVDGPDGPRVVLHNGSRQQIDRVSGRLNVLTFAENTIDLATTQKASEQRYRDAAEMSTAELLDPPSTVFARDIGKLLVEGHRRLTTPLTAASFALVALLSVLSGAFQRHGSILRPLGAVLSVVGLLALGLAIGNLAARQTELIPLIYVHAIVPGLFCAWRLYGSELPRRLRPRRRRTLQAAGLTA